MNEKNANKTFTFDFAGRKVIESRDIKSGKDYQEEIEAILTEKKPLNPLQANTVLNQDIGSLEIKVIREEILTKNFI
jgi:hypothetical protein